MMAKTTQRTGKLRVPYAEAQRVRRLLLSSEVESLSNRDVTTIVKILNDVYPQKSSISTPVFWQPLLVGVGIGLLLVIGIALFG
jgi:hypothetical protein